MVGSAFRWLAVALLLVGVAGWLWGSGIESIFSALGFAAGAAVAGHAADRHFR
jgi:hypothetical protein